VIDFVSTRDGACPQTRACAKLLAKVISQAVEDASEPLTDSEVDQGLNRNYRASTALRFLFDRGQPFEAYARLIGSDAMAMRLALLRNPRHAVLRARYDLSEFFVRGVEA